MASEEDVILEAASKVLDEDFDSYAESRVPMVEDAIPFCQRLPSGELEWNFHEGQAKVIASDKRIVAGIAGRQGGKCGRFDVLLENGSRVFVKDIKIGDRILSLDEATLKVKPAVVTGKWENGIKPIYRVTTTTGREIVVTDIHPLYGKDGWQETKYFKNGDWIGVPRSLPVKADGDYSTWQLRLLGYLLGDGGTSQSGVNFTNADRVLLDDIQENIPASCQLVFRERFGYSITKTGGRETNDKGHVTPNPVKSLVREWGIDCLAKHKRIPKFVFNLRNDLIAQVLNRLFACDGWIDGKGFGICLASRGMIYDIQHLLLRFGILPRVRYKQVLLDGKKFDAWSLSVVDFDSLCKLRDMVGILSKDAKLAALIEHKKTLAMTYNRKDNIPNFPIDKCDYETRRSHRSNSISRHKAQVIADEEGFGSALAFSDIYWDKIASIEDIGCEETYDIEVKGPSNFIANDIFAHNSVCGPPWLYQEMRRRGPGMYMVVAPSFPLLQDSAVPRIEELFEQYLQLGNFRSNPLRFIVSQEGEKRLFAQTKWEGKKNLPKTTIRFGHAQNPESLEAKTALAAWLDEAGQDGFKLSSWEAIEGRLTTTRGRCLLTTTPYSLGWLKQRIIDPWQECQNEGTEHPDIDVIKWSSVASPAFSMEEYERLRSVMPFWRWDMFYNGNFTVPAGLIYSAMKEREHILKIKPYEKIPSNWPRYGGLDFGGPNTCAVKAFQDPSNGNIVIYDDYFPGVSMRVRQHVERIMIGEQGFDRFFGGAQSEGVWREEFAENGLNVEEPMISDVEVGIQRVQSLMIQERLFIYDNLIELWNELYTYQYETDPDTGEILADLKIKSKKKFHRMDALRYLCSMFGNNMRLTVARGGGERPILKSYQEGPGKILAPENYAPPQGKAGKSGVSRRAMQANTGGRKSPNPIAQAAKRRLFDFSS